MQVARKHRDFLALECFPFGKFPWSCHQVSDVDKCKNLRTVTKTTDSTFRGVLQLTIIICVRYDYVKNIFLSKSLLSWKPSRRLDLVPTASPEKYKSMNFDNAVVIFTRESHDALRKILVKILVLVIKLIFPQTLKDETSEKNPFALETSVIVRGRRHVHLLPLPRIGRILPPLPSTWNLLLQFTLAAVENWGRGRVGGREGLQPPKSQVFWAKRRWFAQKYSEENNLNCESRPGL